jgi:hypothetical protein
MKTKNKKALNMSEIVTGKRPFLPSGLNMPQVRLKKNSYQKPR